MNTLSPLTMKYRTKHGTPYVYDTLTGEIVRVSEIAYEIMDDYGSLSDDEIVAAHPCMDEQAVRKAIADLRSIELNRSICSRRPLTDTFIPERVIFDGRQWSLSDLMRRHCRTLILGITEQCNLRCEYCCYGNHYAEYRCHSGSSMTWEIAQKAIDTLFERQVRTPGITFYGGEPLLELDLIKRIVRLVGERERETGKSVTFSITTNGTLLNDDTIHFLVAHNVGVLISIDGPSEVHDRNRVFRNSAGEKRGTYDDVIKNIRRFAELYPDYNARGISMVLAPPLDLERRNEFLREWRPWYSMNRVSPLQQPRVLQGANSPLWLDFGQQPCEHGLPCSNSPVERRDLHGRNLPRSDIGCEEQESGTPEAFKWSQADHHEHSMMIEKYFNEIECRGVEQAKARYPLMHTLLHPTLTRIHLRSISTRRESCSVLRCLPGFIRLYCDSLGSYYPCERVGTNNTVRLGDVWNGLAPETPTRLLRLFRAMTDCGDCASQKGCALCLAGIHELEGQAGWNGILIQEHCRNIPRVVHDVLRRYTEVLEQSASAFDDLIGEEELSLLEEETIRVIYPEPRESDATFAAERLDETKRLW